MLEEVDQLAGVGPPVLCSQIEPLTVSPGLIVLMETASVDGMAQDFPDPCAFAGRDLVRPAVGPEVRTQPLQCLARWAVWVPGGSLLGARRWCCSVSLGLRAELGVRFEEVILCSRVFPQALSCPRNVSLNPRPLGSPFSPPERPQLSWGLTHLAGLLPESLPSGSPRV